MIHVIVVLHKFSKERRRIPDCLLHQSTPLPLFQRSSPGKKHSMVPWTPSSRSARSLGTSPLWLWPFWARMSTTSVIAGRPARWAIIPPGIRTNHEYGQRRAASMRASCACWDNGCCCCCCTAFWFCEQDAKFDLVNAGTNGIVEMFLRVTHKMLKPVDLIRSSNEELHFLPAI